MKTRLKKISVLFIILITALFSSCEKDLYEQPIRNSQELKVSFNQFKKETGVNDLKILRHLSSNNEMSRGDVDNEFLTDTTGIIKYTSIDNKVTYSFKIYPITEILESKEYYNLVYEKYEAEWNEVIFKNTQKENPAIEEPKLEQSKMIYNERFSEYNLAGFCEAINYTVHCNGSCGLNALGQPNPCDGLGCSTGECIQTTVSYIYCGGIGDNIEADPLSLSTGGATYNGGGTIYSGIYIPNPYDGEADLNNPEFVLAVQVAAFTRTLSSSNPAIKTLLENNFWLFPNVLEYIRNNGGLTQTNTATVTSCLINYNSFQQNLYLNNYSDILINQFKYWAFYSFLHNNYQNLNYQKILQIKNFIIDANTVVGEPCINHLYVNKDSQDALDFVNEIINQIILNPNLFTSIKPFLIEKQIGDSQLNPCVKGVFQQIENTTNNDFAKVLAKLGADGSVYNTTMISAVAPSGAPAQTVWNSPFNYTIYISTDYEDKTKLFIATSMLHELVHAYFMSLFDDYNNGNPPNPNAYNDFAILFQKFVDKTYPGSNDVAHHEQMAIDYVNAIASALQEYQPGLSQQVYLDLAWGGLSDAPIFNNTPSLTANDRTRILNRYEAEQRNLSIGEGTPNAQSPVSQPCN